MADYIAAFSSASLIPNLFFSLGGTTILNKFFHEDQFERGLYRRIVTRQGALLLRLLSSTVIRRRGQSVSQTNWRRVDVLKEYPRYIRYTTNVSQRPLLMMIANSTRIDNREMTRQLQQWKRIVHAV